MLALLLSPFYDFAWYIPFFVSFSHPKMLLACSGALKAANVGLSLSEAEASIAAPFTSQQNSIESVITLIRFVLISLLLFFSYVIYLFFDSLSPHIFFFGCISSFALVL